MDASSVEPQIDASAIRAFCTIVFGYLSGPVTIRLIAETGTPDQSPQVQFTTTDRIAGRLIELALYAARDRRAVFVVPASLKSPRAAKAGDIQETGVILVDLDDGDISAKRDHLALHLGQPSMEVASGGQTAEGQDKLHLYWKLSEAAAGADLDRVASLREDLALKVGGDRKSVV